MPPKQPSYDQGKWAEVFAPRRKGERRYWLVKSEPETFSFDDLWNSTSRTTHWDGVRNTTARNFLRDGMKKGDRVFFYHSMAEPPAVVGVCEVVKEGYADHTAFDHSSDYYDAKSKPDAPLWFMVDIKALKALRSPVSLSSIKQNPALSEMALVRISRLSVSPVTAEEWETILEMGK